MSKKTIVPDSLTNSIINEFDRLKALEVTYIKSYISIGKKLIEAKEKAGFGNWDEYVNRQFNCRFNPRQASKYMKVAAAPELAYAVIKNQEEAIYLDNLSKRIANATNEEKAEAEKIKQAALEVEKQKNLEADAKKQQKEKAKRAETVAEAKGEEIIDVEFEEVKSSVDLVSNDKIDRETESNSEEKVPVIEELKEKLENVQDSLYETISELKEKTEDNESMVRTFESDDKITTALDEAKRYREQNRILQERINGLMSEKNAAIRQTKHWKNEYLKLDKKLKELEVE